jgi:hypothetical protein
MKSAIDPLRTFPEGSYRACVTNDLRNSLKLWGGGILFAALFWLTLHFDLLGGLTDDVTPDWFWFAVGLLAMLNLAQFAWGLWQRRAPNPRNPNHR